MDKKLVKVQEGKMLMGVCAGIAKTYEKDPMLIRALFVLLSFFVGIGPIVYLVLGFTLPEEK